MNNSNLAENYRTVVDRIHAAERQAGRQAGSVSLVAVGKLHPAQAVRTLAECGQRIFAENFVQEAIGKQRMLSDLQLEWHFIGSIQSNKTKDIANHFSWVHSVDRYKIARRLNDQRPDDLPPLNLCVQTNLQGEATKSGVAGEQLLPLLDEIASLPRVRIRGLMIIPEPVDTVERQRAVFARLRQWLELAIKQGHPLDTLSMGMTADMEVAISQGSTHVRIGTALFGPRPSRTQR
ncbi:MAG: YggS family pyridoxal phosphate-dependent enzyme [Acidiferrobacterales bacterium]|nr:YggS family pyridoxal phosphate-dependent enzyme [Acidiferrobacterales bacterium]